MKYVSQKMRVPFHPSAQEDLRNALQDTSIASTAKSKGPLKPVPALVVEIAVWVPRHAMASPARSVKIEVVTELRLAISLTSPGWPILARAATRASMWPQEGMWGISSIHVTGQTPASFSPIKDKQEKFETRAWVLEAAFLFPTRVAWGVSPIRARQVKRASVQEVPPVPFNRI